MWRTIINGNVIEGDRQFIKQQLNIFTYWNEITQEDEIFEVNNPKHWRQAIEDFNLTGDDD